MQIIEKQKIGGVAWVINSRTAGGIGTVCQYAAEGIAQMLGGGATVVSLFESQSDQLDPATGVRYVGLGLGDNEPQNFLQWLRENPHRYIITSDVPRIEAAFPYLPSETLHIVQIHDTAKRALAAALRNCQWLDGVVCVAEHITDSLESRLNGLKYRGLLQTVYNGAVFPNPPKRAAYSGPLRLLYVGSMDPFKGIFDLLPILRNLSRMRVPVRLTIVGGSNELLRGRFKEKQYESQVKWVGRVPHDECYAFAAESDVLLMPSRKEAFGMVTIEAMAMGCVPIAYDIQSGSREIIEHEKNGFLLPLGNFRAWAKAIQSLYEDRARLQQLSTGAAARARTHFNAELMASHLCAFLERLQAHAQASPSVRKSGMPPENGATIQSTRSNYQRLSPSLRLWLRNRIGASPRLCHWLLNRW